MTTLKKPRRLTRNQKIIARFKRGDSMEVIRDSTPGYFLSLLEVERIIRRHCRRLKGAK